MINIGAVHGPQHAFWNVGGSWDLQKMSASIYAHDMSLFPKLLDYGRDYDAPLACLQPYYNFVLS
jgi:hypothetical protein